jgi:hypothetical protein
MTTRHITRFILALAALGLTNCPQQHGDTHIRRIPVPTGPTGSTEAEHTQARWVIIRPSRWHGHPHIELETPRLPALSGDGTRVLLAESISYDGWFPSLRLAIRRVADESVVSSIDILYDGEYGDVGSISESGNAERAQRALQDLIAKVESRIERANQIIGPGPWKPLSKCSSDDPYTEFPPCSMAAQNISCGMSLRAVYRNHTLDVWDGEHKARLPRPGWASPPVISSEGFSISVRECFGGVWIAPERGLLVGELWPSCQEAGDWCYVRPVWHIVKLPFIPKPAPAPR